MPLVAAKGWVIVTRDFAVKRRPAERAAWTAASAIIVMLRGDTLSGADMATMLLAACAHGRLDNFIAKRTAPMVLYLTPPAQLAVHLAVSVEAVAGRDTWARHRRGPA